MIYLFHWWFEIQALLCFFCAPRPLRSSALCTIVLHFVLTKSHWQHLTAHLFGLVSDTVQITSVQLISFSHLPPHMLDRCCNMTGNQREDAEGYCEAHGHWPQLVLFRSCVSRNSCGFTDLYCCRSKSIGVHRRTQHDPFSLVLEAHVVVRHPFQRVKVGCLVYSSHFITQKIAIVACCACTSLRS